MITIEKRHEMITWGSLLQMIGISIIWLFPVGTIAGVLLLLKGHFMSITYHCSECKTKIDKKAKVCSACKSKIEN